MSYMTQPALFDIPDVEQLGFTSLYTTERDAANGGLLNLMIKVPALPKAQPRQRHRKIKTKDGKEFIQNYTPQGHPVNDFKATVRMAVQTAYTGPPLTGPLKVCFVFVFPRQANKVWKSKPMPRYPHVSTPDQDNLCKSVQDALNNLLWADDSQISQAVIEKWHAAGDEQPHVLLTIQGINP